MSRRHLSKGWRWALGIVGTLAALIVVVLVLFDWNWLKPPLEARLSSLTGKQVHIDGNLEGEWAWIPHIALNQVRIEDPNWAPNPQVATVDRIALAVDIPLFLSGKMSFPEIEISKPVLELRRKADGTANWDIANEAKGPSDRGSMPLIGTLKVTDGKLTYRDLGKNLTINAAVKSVNANGGSGDDAVSLDGNGIYRNVPFTIKLKGGSLNDLRETSKPYDLDASAAVGKTKVSVKGTVKDPFKMTDLDLKVTAQGDNAEELYPLFGIPAPPTPPYMLSGMLDRDGQKWLFKNFAGTVGKSDLAGTLSFDTARPRLFLSGNLNSKHLDFADLGLLVGAPGSTAPGRPVSETQRDLAQKYAASDRVLPDAPLRFDEVRNVDADITLKGDSIQAQDLPLESVDLHLKIDNAVMSLLPLHVGVAGGLIDANIVIDARTDAVQTDYDVKFRKFQLQQFFQRAGYPQGGSGNLDGRIRLHGIGDSVRKSLGHSDGQASVMVHNGMISAIASNLLGLDIARTLGLLISGDEQIPLRCMVTDFKVENGVMHPRIFVLDTTSTLVIGSGDINLGNEHLDLSLRGKQKKPTPIDLGGPILVGGTFKSPSVGLGTETIVRGGAAVALGAVLAPLAAILGFIDTGDADDADCLTLEADAQASGATPPPNRTAPRRPAAR